MHSLLQGLDEQIQAVRSAAGHVEDEAQLDEALVHDLESTCFITKQLLEIALMADYGDEIGRRKMFTLIRKS